MVRILSPLLTVVLLIPVPPAYCEDEVETPSRRRQSIFWSQSAVTVITRDDIMTSGANTIQDLLRRIPGMDVFGVFGCLGTLVH